MAKPSLADLLVELHRMSGRERRLIIGQLDQPDRERVSKLLGKASTTPPPSFNALASLSPWLAESLAAARSNDHRQAGPRVTQATREALLEAERLLPTNRTTIDGQASRSLVQQLFSRGVRA